MKKQKKQHIIGAFFGTIVEYYDYSLYGFSASIIASKFFLPSDYLSNLINAYAVYAVAYFSKPLGAIIFGYIGDHFGRKIALSITIVGIAIPTGIIGLLPEFSEIGIWSTIILIICRFLQGLFVAGEYDGAAIYVIEHLGEKYQSTASSITRCSGVVGLLLGIGATNFFNAHIFPEWGWRIPFLLSFPLSLVAVYYRQKFDETPDFKIIQKKNLPKENHLKFFRDHWQLIMVVILIAGGFGVTYQISIIFMKQYLPIVLPQTSIIISTFSVLLVICFGATMPIAGLLADKIGPLRVLTFTLAGIIISCIILIISIKWEMINLALVSSMFLACFVAPLNALAHAIIIKAFPTDKRYRGISFGHTIGSMLMSGSANYICLVFMKNFGLSLFPIVYLCLFAIISYFATRYIVYKYTLLTTLDSKV